MPGGQIQIQFKKDKILFYSPVKVHNPPNKDFSLSKIFANINHK